MIKYSVRFATFAPTHTFDTLGEAMDLYLASNGMADVWSCEDGVMATMVASGMDLMDSMF